MTIAEIKNPDDVVCVMQFSMRLSEWKQIRSKLSENSNWAEIQIINEINDLVWQLEKTLYPNIEKPKTGLGD